jgi:hypothetical protein
VDCTIAQAVSRWLSTAAAWVRDRMRTCGFCGEQSGSETAFIRVLLSFLPTVPLLAAHSSSFRADTICQIAAGVPSGLSRPIARN